MSRKIKITIVALALAVLGGKLYGAEPTAEQIARWRWLNLQPPTPVSTPAASAPITEYKTCVFCGGDGIAPAFWTPGYGKCGTCMGSGVVPLRGFYYVTEDPPARRVEPPALPKFPLLDATPKPATWLTEADLSPDAQPTPMSSVAAGLRALNPKPGEVLVDYGCGFDARWLITACRLYGTQRAIGVEIDPVTAESARRYVAAAGLSARITIITGDATTTDARADIGCAYLWPETLAKLKPKIVQLDRFVSYSHPVPGWASIYANGVNLYARNPPPIQVIFKPTAATWNGRTYTGPLCNRQNCSMCQAIRAQLQPRYVTVPATQQAAAPAQRSGHYETQCQFNRWGRKTGCHQVWVED